MNFVQTEFLWFFAIVFTLYWAWPRREWQNVLLTVASAVFYGWVHPWWLILMYVAAVIDYAAGLAMVRWPARKGLSLTISIVANLLMLGYFKYFDFFVENLATALDTVGVHHTLAPLGILLPAGISFYTFQSMAYSIDVYRGELAPRKNLLDYLLAVSLFCHLVAGPVQRASNLLQQAETPRRFDLQAVRSGFALALWGAFKKVVVADTVSPYVDKVYSLPHASTPLIAAATLGFAVQILADFSGYTDIARGTARMLGFELMENFKHPYLALNPSDFWRRWHISFSSWIRDYLYISMGGSRGTFLRVSLVTFASMVISGLWHGAAWNFLLWGAYHGLLLVGYRIVAPLIPAAIRSRAGALLVMFGFTNLGWFLFRANDVTQILSVLRQNPLHATPEEWIATAVILAVTVASSVPLLIALAVEKWLTPRLAGTAWYLPIQTATWTAFALALFTFVRMTANDFIYFQF